MSREETRVPFIILQHRYGVPTNVFPLILPCSYPCKENCLCVYADWPYVRRKRATYLIPLGKGSFICYSSHNLQLG